jgi:alpha-mannosidase
MLKLSVPTLLKPSAYIGQVAYGWNELPSNGEESVSQKWSAVVSEEKDLALTLINDCVYGSDFADGEMRISLLRSPAHSADPAGERPMLYQDRWIPRIDQGERVFHFWMNGGKAGERLETIDREALTKNEKPYVLSYSPPGDKKKAKPCLVLSDSAAQVTTLKKAEQGKDLIIRLFEPTGRARTTELALPFLRAKTTVSLKGFEIKTLRFHKKTREFHEVDLLENEK